MIKKLLKSPRGFRCCGRCGGLALWGLLIAALSATTLVLWLRQPEVQVEVVHRPQLAIGAPEANTKTDLTVVLVACEANSSAFLESIARQKSQLETAVKSVVYLTQQHVRFVIITNSPRVFDDLLNHTRSWPLTQQAKASFQYVPSEYPAEFKNQKNTFRPCSTQRLFLPAMLPNEDAVLYMDTDVIFLRPPEEFWSFFAQMDDKQAAAGVSFVPGYRNRPRDQRFGKDGFNAGLMLFNLTRIRQFPGGWENHFRSIWKKSALGDQMVQNIIFSKNPAYFFLVGCEWNFRDHYCKKQHLKKCSKELSSGAKAVHGTSGSFFPGGQLQGFFRFWRDLDMSLPRNEAYQKLRQTLESQGKEIPTCGNQKDFINMMTTQIYS